MINVKSLEKCTGCGACANICPKKAITLTADESGFLYPQIDGDKCVNCSLCNNVCQMETKSGEETFERKFYALINKNEEQLKVSSSGGAFLAAAEYVFSLNGVVAGCAFDEELEANHIITYNMDECIEKLCGSKYVQSDTKNVYSEIKKCLLEGKTVLFVGTPCQVEGLYLFLKEKPENLITMDLICHGVSSPLLWKMHKNYLEVKVRAKINKYRFRGKEKTGWALYYYYYYYGNKNRCRRGPSVLDRYYADFLKGINYRESCYRCQFAKIERVGDVTIGDFWGAEKFIDGVDMHNGVSLIAVNSEKGRKFIKEIADKVILKEVAEENAAEDNHNLIKPTARPLGRDGYYQRCFANFELWEKEYVETRAWKIAKLKSMVPSFIKKALRR